MLVKVISAAAAAASFGILFNVQGGNLILTGINGGLGYFVFALCTANNVESYIGMFFASAVMTIFAEIAARRRKVPATIFSSGFDSDCSRAGCSALSCIYWKAVTS